METSKHLRSLGAITALVLTLLSIEFLWGHQLGLVITASNLLIEIGMAGFLLTSRRPGTSRELGARVCFALFFLFIASADSSWTLFYYIYKLDSGLPWVTAIVTGSYGSAFLFGALAILFSLRGSWRSHLWSPATLVAVLISTTVASGYVVPSFLVKISGGVSPVFVGFEAYAILTSFFFLNCAIVGLLGSRSFLGSVLYAAIVSVVFGDWAMRVEKYAGTVPEFGPYEFFWSFGVYVCAHALRRSNQRTYPIDCFERQRLLCNYKLGAIGLVFVSIVILSLSHYATVSSIKVISLGCGFGALLAVLVSHFLNEKVNSFSENLVKLVSHEYVRTDTQTLTQSHSLPQELRDVYDFVFSREIREAKEKERKDVEIRLARSREEVAKQVAHDIRSPLAALGMIERDLMELPEDKRVLVRSAVSRIHDIANNLLENKRNETSEKTEPCLVSALLDQILTEKRMQFRARIGIQIQGRFDGGSYGHFARIQPSVFKRVISNLVNNAAESVEDQGSVEIRLSGSSQWVEIQVQDNGKGIPSHILPLLMQRGSTFDKPGGSGLGLYYAKEKVGSWGGSIEVSSIERKGTRVTIKIPRIDPPQWFVPHLNLSKSSPIVILDDDASVHQIWRRRFEEFAPVPPLKHFSTPQELRSWVSEAQSAACFLIDYELLGHTETGLDLIQNLGIHDRAVLVTSRIDEDTVKAQCMELGVKMIPKGLTAIVPISIGAQSSPAKES